MVTAAHRQAAAEKRLFGTVSRCRRPGLEHGGNIFLS